MDWYLYCVDTGSLVGSSNLGKWESKDLHLTRALVDLDWYKNNELPATVAVESVDKSCRFVMTITKVDKKLYTEVGNVLVVDDIYLKEI